MTDINTFPDFHDTPLAGYSLGFMDKSLTLFLEPYDDNAGSFYKTSMVFYGIDELEVPKVPQSSLYPQVNDLTIRKKGEVYDVGIMLVFHKGPSWEIKFNCGSYKYFGDWENRITSEA